jgi:hypothetical protein
MIENRAINNYTWLVVILKFWHTVFIVIFFLFTLMFLTQVGSVYHGIYASLLQNFIFLYLFSFIMYHFLIKSYMNVLYEYVYSWFFVNKFIQ